MSVKLKYLDKNGLKKILTLIKNWDLIAAKPTCQDTNGDLVPGQKIVELTKAQYNALATKDPDTYYMINDDNDPIKFGKLELDYTRKVEIFTDVNNNTAGYTVPADGVILGNICTSVTGIAYYGYLNDVVIGTTARPSDGGLRVISGMFVVSKGDVLKVTNTAGSAGCNLGTKSAADNDIWFIPWK